MRLKFFKIKINFRGILISKIIWMNSTYKIRNNLKKIMHKITMIKIIKMREIKNIYKKIMKNNK